jgi:hypothetical protein
MNATHVETAPAKEAVQRAFPKRQCLDLLAVAQERDALVDRLADRPAT